MLKARFIALSRGPVAIVADWGGAFGVAYAIINPFFTWAMGNVEQVSNVGLWATVLAGALLTLSVLAFFAIGVSYRLSGRRGLPPGEGGKGGGVRIIEGENIRVQAGRGGSGGPPGSGLGGAGGGAESVRGKNIVVVGGDGGSAGGWDGRGGRPGASPAETAGTPTDMWHFGRGGAGANTPEYDRRLKLLIDIRNQWAKQFPDQIVFVQAGVDQVPINYVNARLGELGEAWSVRLEDGGYVMPILTPSS